MTARDEAALRIKDAKRYSHVLQLAPCGSHDDIGFDGLADFVGNVVKQWRFEMGRETEGAGIGNLDALFGRIKKVSVRAQHDRAVVLLRKVRVFVDR